ncbi:preprotein translocase subunit SecG [Flavobacterium sp.]|jgi:preprotein translocase subunit SecG|uniref:preprotein translocase subunit SecG n=1 Tax=Flavobacterium sp. TaxID=239 RepID=UPI00374D469F
MSTFTIFLVLITIVCFLLIVVIMVQNPKGGGLSSTLGSAQMGGVQKTTDFLDKSTWYLAGALIVLILMSSLSFNGGNSETGSKIIDESTITAPAIPTAPQAAPTETKPTETPVATDAAKPATEEVKK